MLIKRIGIIFFVIWLGWGTPMPGFAESICNHVTLSWIANHLTLPQDSKMIFKQEKEQLCEVILRIEDRLVPVYAGKNFILAGQLFKQGRSITEESMKKISDNIKKGANLHKETGRNNSFFKENYKTLEQFVFLSFKPNQADGFVYVVTDPACSHCKDLLLKLQPAALQARVEVRVIAYPLFGLVSRNMAARAICSKYSYQDYARIKVDGGNASCDQAEQLIKKTELFFRSAGLTFVPLVVAGDGSWVVDVNDIGRIRSHLGILPGKEDPGSGGSCISDQNH